MTHNLRTHKIILCDPTQFELKCKALDEARGVAWDGETDIFGEDIPDMETVDGVAIVPVIGAIANNIPQIFKAFGFCDCADIAANIAIAEADPNVEAIILDIDSPGGTVGGVIELAERIEAASKPIYSHTSGMAASAAYWIASATDGVFMSKSAEVGSIGVYSALQDTVKMFEMFGVRVELFKSGKYKATGFPGVALSDDQRAQIQSEVDHIYGMFKSHLLANRPSVQDDAMQGQTFMGQLAVDAGLADMLSNGISETISEVKSIVSK